MTKITISHTSAGDTSVRSFASVLTYPPHVRFEVSDMVCITSGTALFAWRRHFCGMGSTVLRPNHGAGSQTLVTRRDAAEYITEHADEWQAAITLAE